MSEALMAHLMDALRRRLDTGDEAIDRDNLMDLVVELGESVYSLEWDSGGPGAGAGVEEVYRVGDVYVTLSADFGLGEPCATLDDALGGIFVSGATRSIWCSELTDEEVIARMCCIENAPPVIDINGTDWPYEHIELAHQRSRGEAP